MKRSLIAISALAVAILLALAAGAVRLYSDADVDTVGQVRFDKELEIPPLLEPRRTREGSRSSISGCGRA